jgi:putative ABC transport system substrate-binding protein
MRRREFITLVGGAAVAWPLAASAQQPARTWRIGVLIVPHRIEAVRQGLRDVGYFEGRNIIIDYRPIDKYDQLPALAAELVALKVDVIVAGGSQAVRAAQQATRSIPIVMTGSSDPVGTGLVASLARPGGNVTGLSIVSPDLSGKRLELLREIIPSLSRMAVLWNPDDPAAALSLRATEAAAKALGIELHSVAIRMASDFDSAFVSVTQARPEAFVILSAPIMAAYSERIAEFALRFKLPAIFVDEIFPKAGGLMSYGTSLDSSVRRSAIYVEKILKGANAGELPVEQPTKFELVINLKTAKALGLTLPPSLLARADEVIE